MTQGARCLRRYLVAMTLALVLSLPAVAASAMTPIDYKKYDGNSPVLTFEEFKEYFREQGSEGFITNPATEKPFTEADVKKFWDDMLKRRPDLKPFLDGTANMMPRVMRGLSEEALGDMENMLHSLTSLHSIPTMDVKDLPREGRRLTKELATMTPARLQSAISTISHLDYYELEAVLQAVGTSVDDLRPIVEDQVALRRALQRIPDSNVTLRDLGGVEGVLQKLKYLRLPQEESAAPPTRQISAAGVGGVMGMAAPALSSMVLASAGDGQEVPEPIIRQADDPGLTPPPVYGPDAQGPEHTPISVGIDGNSAISNFENGSGVTTVIDTVPPEVPDENPSTADLPNASCPTSLVTQNQNQCASADSSDFEHFDDAIGDVNDFVDSIGDVGRLASDMALMSNAASQAYNVTQSGSMAAGIKNAAPQVNSFIDLAPQLAQVAASAPNEQAANRIANLLQRHRMISAGMQRAQKEAVLLDDPGVKSALGALGDRNMVNKLSSMSKTLGALSNIPATGKGGGKIMKELISDIAGKCTGNDMNELISKIDSAGQMTIDTQGDVLGVLKNLNGFAGLAKLFANIAESIKLARKVVAFADTVRNVMQSVKAIKSLETMASQVDDTRGTASDMMHTSEQVSKLKTTLNANGGGVDAASIDKAIKAMKRVGEAVNQQTVGNGSIVPPPTQEEFQNFYKEMDNVQALLRNQGDNATANALGNVSKQFGTLKGGLSNAISNMRTLDSRLAPAVNISISFNPKSLLNFQKVADQLPRLSSKLQNVPNLRTAMDQLTNNFAKIFSKLDDLRKQICIRAPNYTIYYCLPPIQWPVSQGNLYAMINSFQRDNTLRDQRFVGLIAGDSDSSIRFGDISGMQTAKSYAMQAVLGFNTDSGVPGVAGSVPRKALARFMTPKVSPLNLNEGWMLRSTCPRTPPTYGWQTDEFDEYTRATRDPSTDFKLPQDARNNILMPTLEPGIKNAINCAPIKPAMAGCDYKGCNPPFFNRLMLDSCANQFIASQSLFPTYIADMNEKPTISPGLCQHMRLMKPDDCMVDARGKCMEDPERPGVIRHEYDAWRYLERAWYGTLVNNYFPAIYFPTINHFDEKYIDEYQKELMNPDAPNTTYMRNPHAQIVAPGIQYFHEEKPTSLRAEPVGADQFRQAEFRPQLEDIISHPYERILDVTHPFTPRWDYETTDREKYNVCISMGLKTPPAYCGATSFWGIPGAGRSPEWGMPEACARTPVDILRFREKRFDNCIMCRITTNRDCLWSEVKSAVIIPLLFEIAREVIHILGTALCFGAEVCGDIAVFVVDTLLLDPAGHNNGKNLWRVDKSKLDQTCTEGTPKHRCRSMLDPIRALILILKQGGKGEANARSGNPYDTPLLRWLTGSVDPNETQVDTGAMRAIMGQFKNFDFKKAYSTFKRDYPQTWKNQLRPIAMRDCGTWFGGKFPELCVPARMKLRSAFKSAFGQADGVVSKTIEKMGVVSFCWGDGTKKGRDMRPACSTSFEAADKDPKMCKEQCKVSIIDCCGELAKPLAPLNILKMVPYTNKEKKQNIFAEGTTFEEYFGDHRPYMRLWDTGTEWGAVNGKSVDLRSDVGARIRIAGVGTDDRSCRIGGWGYMASNPTQRFMGDMCVKLPPGNTVHPLTSWTELKLYQMRTYRRFGLNCLGTYEQLVKPTMMEDVALNLAGGSVVVNSNGKSRTQPWPMSHRGYLWDTDPKTQFPNFPRKDGDPAPVIRGLDNAQPGDIVSLTPQDYAEAYPNRPAIKEQGRNPKNFSQEFVPFLGFVTAARNSASMSQYQDPDDTSITPPTAADKDAYSVEVLQSNAGTYPDACGVTEQQGNAKKRLIYRRATALSDPQNTTASPRLAELQKIQDCVKNGGGSNCNFSKPAEKAQACLDNPTAPNCAYFGDRVNDIVNAGRPFRVFTTRCQVDPTVRECSFEDPKVTAVGKDLWDMVRIYRPYANDYRAGCQVRPTADSTDAERVDINSIPVNNIYQVPEADVMACINDGYDPPAAARYGLKGAEKLLVVSALRGPGYKVSSVTAKQRAMPMKLLAGITQNAQMRRMMANFPEMASKPYIGYNGVAGYQSDHLFSLTADASVRVTSDSPPHSGSTEKPGYNGLDGLFALYYTKNNAGNGLLQTPVPISGNALSSLLAGGGARLGSGSGVPATSGFNPKRPPLSQTASSPTPITDMATNANANTIKISEVELHLPPSLNRDSEQVKQDEAEFVPDVAISKYPGFVVRGLSGDAANVILPPCEDPTQCYGTPLVNGAIAADGKDMIVLTPPDTKLQIKQGIVKKLVFPYGVSFRHECNEMVKIDGYAEVSIFTDGKLQITGGEKAQDDVVFPLHKDVKADGNYLTFQPKSGYIPAKGDLIPIDATAPLIPAINSMRSGLDDPLKPRPAATPYDGMDKHRVAYDAEGLPQPDIGELMNTVNDICHDQDDHTCPDGLPPGYTTSGKIWAGIDTPTGNPADSSPACQLAPESNACTRAQADICYAQPNGADCTAKKDYCTSNAQDPSCTAVTNCASVFNGPTADYQACLERELDKCTATPDAPGCAAGDNFCAKNPTAPSCAGYDAGL